MSEKDVDRVLAWLDRNVTRKWHPGPIQALMILMLFVLMLTELVQCVQHF